MVARHAGSDEAAVGGQRILVARSSGRTGVDEATEG
jgi:hypothetical protein